jgi:hypothetical protein
MNFKKVTFNDTPCIICEPSDLSYALHLSRISDYQQRLADYYRMERLLAPILAIEHRCKMYKSLIVNNKNI